jgi:hypothetical protein
MMLHYDELLKESARLPPKQAPTDGMSQEDHTTARPSARASRPSTCAANRLSISDQPPKEEVLEFAPPWCCGQLPVLATSESLKMLVVVNIHMRGLRRGCGQLAEVQLTDEQLVVADDASPSKQPPALPSKVEKATKRATQTCV